MKKLVIATRKSALALWQSNFIRNQLLEFYPQMEIVLQEFTTRGDKILDTPLARIGGKQLFTKELEDALLEGRADLAVHSLKDVPVVLPQGLVLAAVSQRQDERDMFLSFKYPSLRDLPRGAVIGTTSLRRKMQLLLYRDDLRVKDLRGNVQTRLGKLEAGEYDAIILAAAGIKRLGLESAVKFAAAVDTDVLLPAMGQAALGVEARQEKEILELLSVLNHSQTALLTGLERDFIRALNGGCQVPIGVNASVAGGVVKLRAILGLPSAKEIMQAELSAKIDACSHLGTDLANDMISRGAQDLLQRALQET